MKKTVLLALVGFVVALDAASAALALDPGSSWSEIRGTPNVIARIPLIFFGTRGVPVTEVCVKEDTLRTVEESGVASEVPRGTRSLSYDIQVVQMFRTGERDHDRLLFIKHHDIRLCQ
jgi:hypothetical protein